MKITAIIAEYNPFHNGHAYHLEETRKITGCEGIIAIMSGSFVQRGEPAIIDKFSRARAAILEGCDLVLELPVIYSLQSAQNFARGAVKIITDLQVVHQLSFGMEANRIEDIHLLVNLRKNFGEEFERILHDYLKGGFSYAAAVAKTSCHLSRGHHLILPQDVFTSNNILATEYLRALDEFGSSIPVIGVCRKGQAHNDERIGVETCSSASAIRVALFQQKWDLVDSSIPLSTKQMLKYFHNLYGQFPRIDHYSDYLYYLLTIQEMHLSNIVNYEPGLEMLISKIGKTNHRLSYIVEEANCRRYKKARIRRFIFNAMLGIDNAMVRESFRHPTEYIRPLAFNRTGIKILKEIKKRADIHILSKFADMGKLSQRSQNLLKLEAKATDFYHLPLSHQNMLKDYITSPSFIEKN